MDEFNNLSHGQRQTKFDTKQPTVYKEEHMLLTRLDKILSDTGTASRRDAAALIKRGGVTVNGVPAVSGAQKIDADTAVIAVNGTTLSYKRRHYFMMNKPSGVVSATEDQREKTITDLLSPADQRLGLFPAGRLDKDAEGLLILTDDGDYAHRIISPVKKVEKTYYVETDGALTENDRKAFEKGIILKDGLQCLPGNLNIIDTKSKSSAYVTICEGKYHQVKRMLASLGKPVTYLKRVSIGCLLLDKSLSTGAYRELSAAETESVFSRMNENEPKGSGDCS
jgi:16S rRNA pseudouridine516 synthase